MKDAFDKAHLDSAILPPTNRPLANTNAYAQTYSAIVFSNKLQETNNSVCKFPKYGRDSVGYIAIRKPHYHNWSDNCTILVFFLHLVSYHSRPHRTPQT